MILQTLRQRVGMCVPSEGFHTLLTCFITEQCGSANVVQLTIAMNVQTDNDGKVTGTADVSGGETIGVCSPTPMQSVPVSLSFPVTGSGSNLVFGATTITTSLLSNQSINFKRTVGFAGRMSNSTVAGTLTYDEELTSPASGLLLNATGSTTLDATLSVRAVPR